MFLCTSRLACASSVLCEDGWCFPVDVWQERVMVFVCQQNREGAREEGLWAMGPPVLTET